MISISHKKFNNILSIVVILLAVYILILPFLPLLKLSYKKHSSNNQSFVYANHIEPRQGSKPTPSDNRIVIPTIFLNEEVKESKNISVINNGATWHRPQSSNPAKGGNTVIIGHRYTYKGASTFYNLDKVHKGDPIVVYWEGKEHDYRVNDVQTVSPNTIEIEKNTADARLTIYTCTPLWNAKNRLVVTAIPIEDPR